MSDETDLPAGGAPEGAAPASAETPAAGSEPDKQPEASATEGQPKAEVKETPSPAPGDPGKPTDPGKPKDPPKPQSRRSAKFRIEQLAGENAEYKKKFGPLPKAQETEQPDQGDPQPDPDPKPHPDVRQTAREEAQRLMEPMLKEHSKAQDDSEINELFSGTNSGKRAEYEPKIREAWNLPQYKDLAASDLLKLLTYDNDLAAARLQAVEDYKKAEKEAKNNSGSGTSARKDSKEKTAWDKTEEEFQADVLKAKTGG